MAINTASKCASRPSSALTASRRLPVKLSCPWRPLLSPQRSQSSPRRSGGQREPPTPNYRHNPPQLPCRPRPPTRPNTEARHSPPPWAIRYEGVCIRLWLRCSFSAPYFSGEMITAAGGLIETGEASLYRGNRYSFSRFVYQFLHNSRCGFSHPAKASKRRKMWRVMATPTATSKSVRNGP